MDLKKLLSSSNVYYFSVLLLAASLPLSIFTTSAAEILLILNWLREGDFAGKWRILKKRKSVLIIISLYFLHLIGLIYTQNENFNYALHDLKIKLPILILPVIFATSRPFTKLQLRFILLLFATATIVSTLISLAIFMGIIPYEYYDFRDISIFISHIRLALMVNLSVFIILYYIFNTQEKLRIANTLKLVYGGFIFWLVLFLVLLKSLTGLFILISLALILAWIYSSRINRIGIKRAIRFVSILIPLLIVVFLLTSVKKFYKTEDVDFSKLEKTSISGNPYYHDTTKTARENGHYVWLYLSEKELSQEWNKISEIKYDELDRKNQWIKYTLIRYLTSVGERKDSAGVASLAERDIEAIENGKANYLFLNRFSLYTRIYEIIWEIDSYLKGGDPTGHSVAQRIAYLDAAKYIIKKNWIFGVGTGDVQNSFNQYYESTGSSLSKIYRRRAHNQYITFFLSFGIVGFLLSMTALFGPVFYEKMWKEYLIIVFMSIAMISLINEDTLETQTGVSFFMFFYSLLLFARDKEKKNE